MIVQSYSSCTTGKIVYKKVIFTRGAKIFLVFLFIEYLIPLFLNLIYDTQPIFRLPIQSLNIKLIILLLISSSIFASLLARFIPTITPRTIGAIGPIKPLPRWLILFISLITILVGYYLFNAGLTQWRYTTSISSNTLILYASIAQTFLPAIAFWVLMTDHQFILSRSRSDIFVKFIMLLGIIFSINGLGSIFITLLFTVVLIAPEKILAIMYYKTENLKKKQTIVGNIALLISLPIIVTYIFSAASFTKGGSLELSFKENLNLNTIGFNYLVNRHSVHLSSLAASIEDGPNISNLEILFDSAFYRLKILTGIDSTANRPEVTSFARLALLQFASFEKINPKGGSSPGLLASVTMVLPFPLSMITIFIITLIIIKLLDFILCRQPPFTCMGAIIFAYIPFRFLTDSPLDLIIPGPTIIILFLIFLLSLRRKKIEQ
jgi:hypothetical protein